MKVGDLVIRINSIFNGMKPGDMDIIVSEEEHGVSLKNYSDFGSHDRENLTIVPEILLSDPTLKKIYEKI